METIETIIFRVQPGGEYNEDDRQFNRQALAEGAGETCLYVGNATDRPAGIRIPIGVWEAAFAIDSPHKSYINSIEVYDNGAINAFVRTHDSGERAVGFIRYRCTPSGAGPTPK